MFSLPSLDFFVFQGHCFGNPILLGSFRVGYVWFIHEHLCWEHSQDPCVDVICLILFGVTLLCGSYVSLDDSMAP